MCYKWTQGLTVHQNLKNLLGSFWDILLTKIRQIDVDPNAVHFLLFLWPLPAVCQSWGVLVSQTDFLSQAMKKRSEDLLDGPISKLTLLIRDKQQLRKTYAEQWSLLRQELNKVCDENTHASTHRNSNTPLLSYKQLQSCQQADEPSLYSETSTAKNCSQL